MKRTILIVVAVLAAATVALLAVLLVRAVTFESRQVAVEASTFKAPTGAAERLSEAVRLETISHADPAKMDMAAFDAFHTFLQSSYPAAHQAMHREAVAPCSVVYTWPGADPAARPVLIASHIDVVPVEAHEAEQWTRPPFSGAIADGFVWGRGTLDDKVGVLGLMEGVETLARTGKQPARTIVLAFGCDEEVGGTLGARKIAKLFAERNQSFEFAFDEGLAIVEGYMPGISNPVALVGLVEKGFVTFELIVESEGGHSSMPPKQTAIGILADAISALESNPLPAKLNPVAEKLFAYVGPEMPFGLRIVFANLWLLEPVLVGQLEAQPSTNASVRTTTAVTVMNAGVQDNVLPKRASAKVNFRILPTETIADVRRHIVETIDDERVQVKQVEGGFGNEPSAISSDETFGFQTIRDAIRATFGNEVVVAPSATTGGTDVRHYEPVSDDQYRFAPVHLRKASNDTARIHGVDERISVGNYEHAVVFYTELLSRL